MNILIDDFPRELDGLPIRTDYRMMVMFEELLHDAEIPDRQKVVQGVQLLFEQDPQDWTAAWDALLWYYRGGPEPVRECSGARNRPSETAKRAAPVYDFEQDAALIYAAFRQIYGVDLQAEALHWWAFRAMLLALPDTCLMGRIMQIRSVDVSKLKGTEKKRYAKLQQQYAVRRNNAAHTLSAIEREEEIRRRTLARFKEAEEWKKSR